VSAQLELPAFAAQRHAAHLARVIAAALANLEVQQHIAAGRAGWTEARVRAIAPARFVFEFGELRGNVVELSGLLLYAGKRQLGAFLGVEPLEPDDEVSPFFVLVALASTHPRRVRFEARAQLKQQLGRDRAAVQSATRLTQARFVEWVRERRGLSTRIRERTGLTVKQLWRRARAGSSRARKLDP
jgi:hypothetical protein